eukprot:jgi/Chlat1/6343/Chrsp44S05906
MAAVTCHVAPPAPPSTTATPSSENTRSNRRFNPVAAAPGAQVRMSTGSNSVLGVSIYPDFNYDASSGRGKGKVTHLEGEKLAVTFEDINIPTVSYGTAWFLGVPLPPFIKIKVEPKSLKGFLQRDTGEVNLEFIADFLFSIGSLYAAPPLKVVTNLTTESATGQMRSGVGSRMDGDGRCTLVGVARVPTVDDVFLNTFLRLPTDTLAKLPAQFEVVPEEKLFS